MFSVARLVTNEIRVSRSMFSSRRTTGARV